MRPTMTGQMALCGLVCALCACDSDLPDYNVVEGLRVLAVASDPPWISPGATSTVSALVVTAGEVQATWSWCPRLSEAEGGFVCLEPEALEALPSGSAGPRAAFSAPEDLDTLCARTEAESCEDGVQVYLRLDLDDGLDTVAAVRPLWIPRTGASHGNPGIASVALAAKGVRTELSEVTQVDLPWSKTATLSVVPAPEASEPAGDGTERLTVSWFVDHGELDFGRTRLEPDEESSNPWTLPGTAVDAARIFVVLRDDRGGTSWRRVLVEGGAR